MSSITSAFNLHTFQELKKTILCIDFYHFCFSFIPDIPHFPLISFTLNWIISFNISFRAGLLVTNYLNLLHLKCYFTFSLDNKVFIEYRIFSLGIILIWLFFSFIHLNCWITFFWPPCFLMENLQSFVSLFLFMKCIVFLWLFSGLSFVSRIQHFDCVVFGDDFFGFICLGFTELLEF